jgi:hypothetical protein
MQRRAAPFFFGDEIQLVEHEPARLLERASS